MTCWDSVSANRPCLQERKPNVPFRRITKHGADHIRIGPRFVTLTISRNLLPLGEIGQGILKAHCITGNALQADAFENSAQAVR
jgi:hypothetical protein